MSKVSIWDLWLSQRGYEEVSLLEYIAKQSAQSRQMISRNISTSFSGLHNKQTKKPAWGSSMLAIPSCHFLTLHILRS